MALVRIWYAGRVAREFSCERIKERPAKRGTSRSSVKSTACWIARRHHHSAKGLGRFDPAGDFSLPLGRQTR